MKRLERNLQKRQERKALGPTIGGQQRDMNPFTARNADADPFVLEGIRTVNYGRGVLDPTPFSDVDDDNFAMAAMTVVPEGHIPGMNGGLRQSGYDSPYPEHAVNVAPREIRPVAPAVIRNQTDLERTDVYYDGFRDSDGHEWHYPPPKNFEVERAVYDALRKEIKDRGLISVNQPKRPPLHGARKVFWNEGDPLYQLVPRSELAKIMKRGLTPPRPDSREPFNRFVTTPSAYNETWPYVAGHSSNEGASWIRVSPTPELDSVLSSLAKIKNSQRKPNPMGRIYVNEKGRSVDLTSNSIDREIVAGLFNGDPMIAKLFIPTENVEVLTQSGEWIPLIKSDLRDFGGGGDPTAAMADQKKPSRLRRMIGRVSKREERVDVTPTTAQSIDALNIPSSDPYRIGYSKNYGGDELIVSTQRMLRISHEALAGAGMWDEIHKDHYDWFAYPIDRGSAAYGETFNVAGEPLERLKNNPEFLRSIAREIEIQALALGWNLYGKKFVDAPNWEKGQDWQRAYPTRFWKFTRSAQIFGLEEEFESLLILQASLEQAGIRFNHASYWENPGTVDDVPPVSSAYPKNDRTRFPASDGNGYPFPGYGRPSGEPKYQGDDLFGGSLFPDEATRAEEERAWREYDDYSPGSDPILSDAEDLAEVLGNPDMAMEPNYPYANIDRETRELVSDDINFAVSLIADGQYLDEEKVDRAESAAKLNEYAFSIEGLSPDDVDILQNLADALGDPGLLGLPYDDGPVAPMRPRKLSEETEAQLVADWESGSSAAEIARKFDIHLMTVYGILKRNDTERQFRPRSAISDETEASIVADWESGSSAAEIARKFDIHLMTVYGILKRNVTERQFRPRSAISDETKLNMVADWESGSSVAEIAEKYSVYPPTVYAILRRGNVKRKIAPLYERKLSEETEAQLVADWESGSSVGEIARKYGISSVTVYDYLKRNDTERQFRVMPRISDETEASIVADWEYGSSVAKIARKFGIDRRAVYGVLRRNVTERQFRVMPRISDETEASIVADWESGSSAREIAQKYSVTQPTVYAILRRGNAKRKIAQLHGRKLSEETEAQLVADWESGSSVDEIARKYDISRVTVYGYLQRNDVDRQLRPRPQISDETAQNASDDGPVAPMRRRTLSEETEAQLVADWESGSSAIELSEKYGLSETGIRKVLRRRGTNREAMTNAGRRMLSEETEAQLVADWESGSSAIELSEKYGLTETGIRNLLRRRGANRAFLEKNRLSEEAQTQLVADWESGLSVIELSEKYNVAQQTVYRLLKKRDANRPLAPVRYPDEERLNIAIDYESGMPIAEILEKYGVTQETVTDIAREFGIPLRLRKLSDETVRAILADYEEGYTLKAIANRHGVSTTTVGQIARRHFKTPRGPEKTKLDHYGIAKDYRSGMPITEIMEKYGVSSGVVNYAAKKYGLQPRLTQITEKQIEEINRRHKEGMTIREIAEKMNMDWRKVYRVLKRNSPAPTASAKKRTRKLSDEGVVERAGLGDLLDNEDPAATMAKGIVSRATDEEKQLRMRSSLPGVSARSDSRNGVMKPYLLGEPGIPEKTDLRIPDFVAATRDAGLGAYAVEGTKIAKVQGPIVSDFADRLIGPKIVSDAVATVFPSASQLFEIYAVNALLRARAEFLAGGELTADFVNEAILVGRPRFGRNQAGGFFWTPSDPSDSEKYEISPVDADNTIGAAGFGVLDPHHAFRPSDFITEVIRRMPQAVKDLLTVEAFKRQPTVRDSGIFGKPIIREDDDSSRRIAPLIREQIRVAEEHAVLQDEFAEKWARTAYELMREAGMSDAEIAGTIERHWYVTGGTDLTNVEYNKSKGLSTIDAAFDVALRTVAARFAPILPRGAIEDYPLHEFFHHYLGQGFTRHGEYSGFRGPAEMIGSFHGHLQEMLNTQLNKFVISVFGEHFDYSDMPRDLLMRKIVDEIRRRVDKMLDGSDAERGIVELVFPELMTASSQERAIIRQLISNQFAPNATGRYEFGKFAPPVLRLLTAHGLLVPLEFYPFGDNGRLIDAPPKRTYG